MQDFLFFDIETTADPSAVALLPEPAAPSNYKDPEKIAQFIAEKKAALLKDGALDPGTCRIVALALRRGLTASTEAFLVGEGGLDEAGLLRLFWEAFTAHHGQACGYGIINFDLPVILRRSMDLGICAPAVVNLSRYRTEPLCDLFGILYNWSLEKAKGLKWVARRFGIPNPLPDLDGSMVPDMTPEQLRMYVANDVDLEAGLFVKMAPIYFPHLMAN